MVATGQAPSAAPRAHAGKGGGERGLAAKWAIGEADWTAANFVAFCSSLFV